jgi:hypothetical protein
MKRSLTLVGVAVIAFVLGAAGLYMFKREPKGGITSEWIPVKAQEFGVSWAIDIIKTDIPEPKTDPPSGKVKFLNRDRGIQLGYVLKLPIKANPTSALPAKYLKTTKSAGGLEIGPPDQVHYVGNYTFTLKDADGFVLLEIPGPSENVAAASDNSVQGITEGTIPPFVAERTKTILVRFTMDSCYPCDAE